MDSLVSPAWLAEHLDDPDLVVLDVRVTFDAGAPVGDRAAYRSDHIAGAVFADLPHELCDGASDIGFALPAPDTFCHTVGRLGVGDSSRVVLYDSRMHLPGSVISSMWAARAWWMLRWVGFDQVALLDGGYEAWVDGGHPVRTGDEDRTPQVLTPHVRPQVMADRDEVLDAVRSSDVALVDTLGADHFDGSRNMYARPGHITGAVNRPVFDLYDDTGCFVPTDRLVERFAGLPPGRVITYCGGGVAASASAFAMVRAGVDDVAVYTASLQEWAADPTLPMDTGAAAAGD